MVQKRLRHSLKNNGLLVNLLSLNHAFLLGSLLGNLAVVVRLSRAGCGEVRGDLGLDGVDGAAALVLLDGLFQEYQRVFSWTQAVARVKLPEW